MDKFEKRQKRQKALIVVISLVLILTMFGGYVANVVASGSPTPGG